MSAKKPGVGWILGAVAAAVLSFGVGNALRVGAQGAARTGGPKEGIVVHGHWTIDIRQPDGTLVSHQQFENDLTDNGVIYIGDLLAGRAMPSLYSMTLSASNTLDGPCLATVGGVLGGYDCLIFEPGFPAADNQALFANLQRAPAGLYDQNGLLCTALFAGPCGYDANRKTVGFGLSGTDTAGRVAHIDGVTVGFSRCGPTSVVQGQPVANTLKDCANYSLGRSSLSSEFSGTRVRVPATGDLIPGQLIQASVTYSFSSLPPTIAVQ